MHSAPDPAVTAWIASRALDTLFTTTVIQAEMMDGARILPAGQRGIQLESAVSGLFEEDSSRSESLLRVSRRIRGLSAHECQLVVENLELYRAKQHKIEAVRETIKTVRALVSRAARDRAP